MVFWRKNRVRDHGRDVLRHIRHVRRMREDVMSAAELAALRNHERTLSQALASGNSPDTDHATKAAEQWFERHAPRRSHPALRENLEILAVAIGVAMACRTYFIQPFKIPTGSMQPTLYGIVYTPSERATLMDRLPLKFAKWLITGAWYESIETGISGKVSGFRTFTASDGGQKVELRIHGGTSEQRHHLPVAALPRLEAEGIIASWSPETGTQPSGIPLAILESNEPRWYVADTQKWLPRGTVLWRGARVAGDHVFVDRVRWNFFPPQRGQIIVFNTEAIPTLPPKTHYIKRLVGLPGETVTIEPPNLLINGEHQLVPAGIARIAERSPGYDGYKLVDARTVNPSDWALRSPGDAMALDAGEYFALGDNTGNSRDGRYWGAVPQQNLVGPAAMVYWPLSRRWGIPK